MKLQLNQKDWSCKKKIEARQVTIIDSYKDIFCLEQLPFNKQYWTLCGQCVEDKNLVEYCEYDHIVNKENLITSDQWYGVDWNKEVTQANKIIGQGTWLMEDIEVALSNSLIFNPGIINLDYTAMYNLNISQLARIMNMCIVPNVMIVYNTIQKYRGAQISIDSLKKELLTDCHLSTAIKRGNWRVYDKCFTYKGTGKTPCNLATFIFYKI